MKTMKKFLAVLLALCMALSLMTAALAAGTPSDVVTNSDIKNRTHAVKAMPALNTVTEQFLSAISAKLGINVTGDAVTVTPDGLIIALDKPNGIYGGSKLTSYNDNATYALASTYSAEAIALFDEWRMTDGARTSEKFSEFTGYARLALAILLPDMSEEEIDNILAAILMSNTVGLELTAETVPAFWTEDTIALGMETLEGYVFYLLVQGNDLVLGICEV